MKKLLTQSIKRALVIGAFASILSGCDNISGTSTGSTGSTGSALSSFNLSDISAGTTDVKQMTLTWTSASDNTGITYSVCRKDTTKTNNCDELGSVTDALTATVTVDSLVEAITSEYFILASSGSNTQLSDEVSVTSDTITNMIGYVKASNTGASDVFASSVALSNDGSTLAVGAYVEDNGATGVITNGSETTDTGTASSSGAVYLFSNSSGRWAQTAYVKASNTGAEDRFGYNVALSGDGITLAVGAYLEDNSATGVITDGSETTDTGTASGSGAVYLFSNSSGSWAQTAYVKASNTGASDGFGYSVALSSDGSTLAVGAYMEDNDATGVITDGSEITDTGTAHDSGAVYLFSNSSGSWAQTAYVKASNTGANDQFGDHVALSGDGITLAVGAYAEDNSATGVITDGSETTDAGTATESGAVYLFSNSSGSWAQTAYVKASNTGAGDRFGSSAALSSDGSTLAVGAYDEDNDATGVITDGTETTDTGTAFGSGAVYLFSNSSGSWAQTAYVKASNTGDSDYFGYSVALSSDGSTLAVSAFGEDNSATGVITDGSETTDTGTAYSSGAAYLFSNSSGSWAQTAYVKASNTGANDDFGAQVALSSDGSTLTVGAFYEDNSATGVITDGSESVDTGTADGSGAVYLY